MAVKESLFSPLTFHFHDLIGVLDHFIFGLIAECMCPGLNQIEDLIPDICFHLFLKVRQHEKRTRFCHKAMTPPGNRNHVPMFMSGTMAATERRVEVLNQLFIYHVTTKEEWNRRVEVIPKELISEVRPIQRKTTLSKSFSSSIVCLLATSSWTVWPQFFTTDSST